MLFFIARVLTLAKYILFNMKKILLYTLPLAALIATISPSYGQYYENVAEKKPSRWFFGGNFGLSAGTITYIEVAPHVGYKLTPKLSVGSGIKYQYFNDRREDYGHRSFETHVYGLNLFSTYSLFNNLEETLNIGGIGSILLHAEYEGLSLERRYFDYPLFPNTGRMWVSNYLVGVGLRQPLGERSSVNILILWSINPPKVSLYSNPIIRVGFNF